MESRRRSLVKSLSWRFFATIITTTIAFFLTGKLNFALEIGMIDTGIKVFVYFLHERVWVVIPYGKIEKRDYQI